ncbi:MAG: hypothetical protein ABR972_16130 [Acidimicrobiales bacterium]
MQTQPPAAADESIGIGEEDPLAEIDRLIQKRRDDEQRSADQMAQLATDRSEFSTEFETVFEEQVRPSMEAIIDRLRRNGGDGVIVERPEDGRLKHNHLFTLWMSLDGEITGAPREDRLPYLQLEADVDKRLVTVSEGDMWEGHGGNRSGRVGEWKLSEITATLVTQEALAILRRSFH